MNKLTPPPSTPSTLSWRDLPQRGPRRNITEAARKRRWTGWVHTALVAVSVAVLGLGSWLSYDVLWAPSGADPLSNHTPQGPGRVVFETDGVLNQSWLMARHSIPISKGVMAVDIHQLKRTLESNGQIREAAIEVRLPNTLLVRISERTPVLRVRVRAGAGETKTLLIARDGTVYEGSLYPQLFLERLPGAADLSLRPEGTGYARVEGMEKVADLLDVVREQHPDLYSDWKLISFDRIHGDEANPDTVIKVSGTRVQSLVFAPGNVDTQLQRLTRILGYAQANRIDRINKVDLSYNEQAVVQFK